MTFSSVENTQLANELVESARVEGPATCDAELARRSASAWQAATPCDSPPAEVRGLRRAVYLMLAAICLVLGLLGALLPGLPTTPFLLLMSYLLIRSSPSLHQQVLRLPGVGKCIRDWDQQRAVRRSVKVIAFVWVGIAAAVVLITPGLAIPLKLAILALVAAGLGVIWRLPCIEE